MTDRESEFARKVALRLDRGLQDLRPGTLYRLQQARAAALAGAAARAPGGELATAGAGGVAPGGAGPRAGSPGSLRWIGLALLVAGLGYGFQQWQAAQTVREFEEIDLHLLASDLPIDAYLDRGFQNWLRTAFEH